MIFSSVDLPAPLEPMTPILAPGKNDSQMPLRISRLGGTTLRRSFITNTYCCAMAAAVYAGAGRGVRAGSGGWLTRQIRPVSLVKQRADP